jgi:uncharacterized protein YceK
MKEKNGGFLGLLAIVLVVGIMVSGCASYMDWYYTTLPGGKEQHDRQMAEINERYRDSSSSGSNSSGSTSNQVNYKEAAEKYYQDYLRRHNWPTPGTNAYGDNRGSGFTNHGGGAVYTFHLSRGEEIVHQETVDFSKR